MSTHICFDSPAEVHAASGREVCITDWVEITQDHIRKFAEATGDFQWIHVDVERARASSPFGGTIAHGFLTLSLLGTRPWYRCAAAWSKQVQPSQH